MLRLNALLMIMLIGAMIVGFGQAGDDLHCQVNATVYNTVFGAKVYSIADTSAPVIDRVYSRQWLEVTSSSGDWHAVITPDTFGYIRAYDCPIVYPVYLPLAAQMSPWMSEGE